MRPPIVRLTHLCNIIRYVIIVDAQSQLYMTNEPNTKCKRAHFRIHHAGTGQRINVSLLLYLYTLYKLFVARRV